MFNRNYVHFMYHCQLYIKEKTALTYQLFKIYYSYYLKQSTYFQRKDGNDILTFKKIYYIYYLKQLWLINSYSKEQ